MWLKFLHSTYEGDFSTPVSINTIIDRVSKQPLHHSNSLQVADRRWKLIYVPRSEYAPDVGGNLLALILSIEASIYIIGGSVGFYFVHHHLCHHFEVYDPTEKYSIV